MDRLFKTANQIFGDFQAEDLCVTQLASENTNAAFYKASRPHRGKTELASYIHLCSEIRPSFIQGLALAAAL